MDFAQAERIVIAISNAAFAAMGLDGYINPDLTALTDVSLTKMLEAAKAIEARNATAKAEAACGSYTIITVPAERLIAAVFVLVNYEQSRSPIVTGHRRVVAVLPERVTA